jgi:hypothetical protein
MTTNMLPPKNREFGPAFSACFYCKPELCCVSV